MVWSPRLDDVVHAKAQADRPARLPGGDELRDLGYEPFHIGWYEADQLARVIDAIEDKRDVEDLVEGLLADDEAR